MNLFRKRKKNNSKVNSYKFSVTEIVSIGDKYEYTVNANNRNEAFKKLVAWFYDEGCPYTEDIKQEHWEVSTPENDRFYTSGMPMWFGKCISGRKGNHYEKLKEYMDTNRIISKE